MRRTTSQIILKLAGRCNLNCSYCYVYNAEDHGYLNRPKLISDDVYAAILRRIREYCDRRPRLQFKIAFHGGEPMLVGIPRFRQLTEWARAELGTRLKGIAVQTNATLIDAKWAATLKELGIATSISLDGPASIHDVTRVDHFGRGSHRKVLRGLRRLRDVGIEPTVLCVINPRCSGQSAYRYFRSLGIRQMEFLMPDVSHDNYRRLYGDLGPTPVAEYLIPVLDAWLDENDPDVSIRIFRELFRPLLGGGKGHTDLFGGTGSSYLVVETDGSIEALDALRVCEEGISVSGLNVKEHGFDDLAEGMPLVDDLVNGHIPLAQKCQRCRERDVCGGGYIAHRYSRRNGFNNPSVWCADILRIIDRMREYINKDELERSSEADVLCQRKQKLQRPAAQTNLNREESPEWNV